MSKRSHIPPEVTKLLQDARNLTASVPRKHHLVPASYLRRWEEAGALRVTEVDARRDYVTSAGKAARETDFYRVSADGIDPGEMPPLLFELLLGQIEGWGKTAIDRLLLPSADLNLDMVAKLAWFLAMQFTRGASFRREARHLTNEFFKVTYCDMSDDGIRDELKRRGAIPTADLVTSSRRLLDGVRDGSVTVEPQDAALVGRAGEAAAVIGEHFVARTWVVLETSPIMITCDEPVVLVGGRGSPRTERAGAATAGVVLFPLDPGHILAMFRNDIAEALGYRLHPGQIGRGRLDHLETIELCREVAMNAHRWTFERRNKRVAVKFRIPRLPEPFSLEDVASIQAGGSEGSLVRGFKRNRWANSDGPGSWPITSWWA